MKAGDCVYFKSAKRATHHKAESKMFRGHGVGILLGELPPAGRDLDIQTLFRLMGVVGFLTFDDVAEFLGKELGEKCVKDFEKKYYAATEKNLKAAAKAKPLELIDAHGKPLENGIPDFSVAQMVEDITGEKPE